MLEMLKLKPTFILEKFFMKPPCGKIVHRTWASNNSIDPLYINISQNSCIVEWCVDSTIQQITRQTFGETET